MKPFEKKVLRKLLKTEYGTRFSYGELARQVKKPKAARAVGSVLRKNRLPVIIPCHRVLASGGGLGGFSAGLVWKQRLLALEADNPHGV
jgi:methylated-DNA-[protein]-cysteine S-methyltransferase